MLKMTKEKNKGQKEDRQIGKGKKE